jgi:serine phosphatase RsbU (regulator of sigma subunit)
MIEILDQNQLQHDYNKLYQTNKELVDSMYYARSVQQGVLPHERHFKRLFNDYFVTYKPQGIVGGDLYWVGQKGHLKYFAVGDCTGHGISGAMLSVLALSFLNYIVLGKDFEFVGEILLELDKKWIETFHQGSEIGFNNDWLEIGIACLNEETMELQYAGAFNNLLYVSGNEMKQFSGNKFPIGGWQLEKNRAFVTHFITYEKNAMVYLYSDGFKDQFGFLNGKRFMSSQFKQLLLENSHLPAEEQKEYLEYKFNSWKGTEEQTDDTCVLGIRL